VLKAPLNSNQPTNRLLSLQVKTFNQSFGKDTGMMFPFLGHSVYILYADGSVHTGSVKRLFDFVVSQSVFTMRRYASAICCHRVSVLRPSQAGTTKWLNVGLRKQLHTIAQGLYCLIKISAKFQPGAPNGGGVRLNRDFRPIACLISGTVQDRYIVTIELVCALSNGAISVTPNYANPPHFDISITFL